MANSYFYSLRFWFQPWPVFPTVLSEIYYHHFWEIRTIHKSIESKSQYQADPEVWDLRMILTH